MYLLDDDYGIRGIDFRAPNNPHGICMLICSAWRDTRTRVQGLKRICRFSDNGMYIQAHGVKDIDREKSITHHADVHNAIEEIKRRHKRSGGQKRQKVSATEQEDKR